MNEFLKLSIPVKIYSSMIFNFMLLTTFIHFVLHFPLYSNVSLSFSSLTKHRYLISKETIIPLTSLPVVKKREKML